MKGNEATSPAAAAAISATPAIQYNNADSALVQQVHRKWRRRALYYVHGPYAFFRYGAYGCYAVLGKNGREY